MKSIIDDHKAIAQHLAINQGVGDVLRDRALRREIDSESKPAYERPCTCHPDDNPPQPCPQKYALNDCVQASYDVIAADTQERRMKPLWSVIASSPELLKAWNERDWPTVDRALKAMWTEIPIEMKRP